MGDVKLPKLITGDVQCLCYEVMDDEEDAPFQFKKHQLPGVLKKKEKRDTKSAKVTEDCKTDDGEKETTTQQVDQSGCQFKLPDIYSEKVTRGDALRKKCKVPHMNTRKKQQTAQGEQRSAMRHLVNDRRSRKTCIPQTVEDHFNLNMDIKRDLHLPPITKASQKCLNLTENNDLCMVPQDGNNLTENNEVCMVPQDGNILDDAESFSSLQEETEEFKEYVQDTIDKYSLKQNNWSQKLKQKRLVRVVSSETLSDLLNQAKPIKMEEHHYFWPQQK